MTTAVTTIEEFDVAEQAIAKLKPYLELRVKDANDKEGMAVIRKARLECRTLRTGVEAARKQLKAGYLEAGRVVDAKAKIAFALIEPIETHLIEQENIVKREEERLEKLAAEELATKLTERQNRLHAVGVLINTNDAATYSDSEFEELVVVCTREFEKEQQVKRDEEARQAAIAQANRIEAERLEAERNILEIAAAKVKAEQDAETERQRKQAESMREQQRKIDAERERLERLEFERTAKETADKQAAERLAEELKRREEAEALAKQAEAERLERERLEKIEADKQAEAAKDDKQKLNDFAWLLDKVPFPKVTSEKARLVLDDIDSDLDAITTKLRAFQ